MMDQALQIASLAVSATTMLAFVGGVGVVLFRIGRRDGEIEHLAKMVALNTTATERLTLTLQAVQVTMASMQQQQVESERRLARLEEGAA